MTRDLGGSESLFLGLAAVAFIFLTVFPYETLELPFMLKKRTAANSAGEEEDAEEMAAGPCQEVCTGSIIHIFTINIRK